MQLGSIFLAVASAFCLLSLAYSMKCISKSVKRISEWHSWRFLGFFHSGMLNLLWGRWWSCEVGIQKDGHWEVDWPCYFLGLSCKKEIRSQGRIKIQKLKAFGLMLCLALCLVSSWSWGLAFLLRHFLPSCLESILPPCGSVTWSAWMCSSENLKESAMCFVEARDPIPQACRKLIFS